MRKAHIMPGMDFNDDGRDDILWRNTGGQLSNWLGQADGSFAINDENALRLVPTSWHVAGAGDFNGDGRDDILWRNDNGALSNWLATPSGGWSVNDANAFVTVSIGWQVAGTGDFNGDGRDDILWRSSSGALSNWLATPSGGWSVNDANAFANVPTYWHVVGTGDFNGDGRDDILWQSDDGWISNWLGTENGGWLVNDANAFTRMRVPVVAIDDFNGDGRDDIVIVDDWAFYNLMTATPAGLLTFDQYSPIADASQIGDVAGSGDYNGDGFADLLVREFDGDLRELMGTAQGFVANDANFHPHVPLNWDVAGDPWI